MPDLSFRALSASTVPAAMTPALALRIEVIDRAPTDVIEAALLQCQVRIHPEGRSYSDEESHGLRELFGEREFWDRSLKAFLWAHCSASLRRFSERAEFDVLVPCSFDLMAAQTKYFHALDEGDIPIEVLFSGTVFHTPVHGQLRAFQLPWTASVKFSLPVSVWKETIHHHYADAAPFSVRRDLVERLHRFRVAQGIPTFDRALELLLEGKNA